MNLPELVKELQKYNDGWPWSITIRIYLDQTKIVRASITKIDSDEDGLYIEAEI